MIQVKENLNGASSASHLYWFSADHGGKRCQSLLPIEQKPCAAERIISLSNGELLERNTPKFRCWSVHTRSLRVMSWSSVVGSDLPPPGIAARSRRRPAGG